MPKAKIQRSSRTGKKYMVKFDNPDTGRQNTIHFWQAGSKIAPGTPKAKNFIARHRASWSQTAKKRLNEQTWKGKKAGDTVNIPNKLV